MFSEWFEENLLKWNPHTPKKKWEKEEIKTEIQ